MFENTTFIVYVCFAVAACCGLILSALAYGKHRAKMQSLSYVVRFLTAEQKDMLKRAGVPFETVRLSGGIEGVRFSAVHCKRTLKALNAKLVSSFPSGNKCEELILHFVPPVDPELKRFSVSVNGRLRTNKRIVLAVVRDLLVPSVRKNIVLHTSCVKEALIRDDNFHVFLHSAESGSANVNTPNQIWYAPVSTAYQSFSPTGRGLPFIDSSSNFVVAELIDNCLYLHPDVLCDREDRKRNPVAQFFFDLWPCWSSPRVGLLVRILQNVKEELVADRYLSEIINTLKSDGLVVDPEAAERYRVTSEGLSGRRQEVFQALTRDLLLPVVANDVRIVNCGGRTRSPLTSGAFNIYIASSPAGSQLLDTPNTIWGYRLLKSEKAFVPSTQGLPLVDDQGFIVAELVNSNLYLHSSFIHYGTKAEAALLARILVEVRKELSGAAELTPAEIDRRVCRHFELECERQLAYGVVPVSRVEGVKAELKQTQASYRTLLKSAAVAESELYRVESAPTEELGREFDALLRIPKVKDVKVNRDYIVVTTEILNCKDPRDQVLHEIGAFDIYIPISQHNAVIWKNLTRRVNGDYRNMNAPHVNNEGLACLGNVKDVFPALIARREFAAAIEVAIAFVESVNVDDKWGKYINQWPLAKTGDAAQP